MTKEQIEQAIASVIAEREEIFDELDAIENEDGDEDCLTPQSHVDYLNDRAAELLKEYWELCGKLDAFKAA